MYGASYVHTVPAHQCHSQTEPCISTQPRVTHLHCCERTHSNGIKTCVYAFTGPVRRQREPDRSGWNGRGRDETRGPGHTPCKAVGR